MREARVMIVDDHPLVRAGLRGLISQEPSLCVAGEADGVAGALELVRKDEPDLMLVDLTLADGDGLELIRRLRSHYPALKILVVTMRDEGIYAERALGVGALGFISKNADTAQLIEAVRTTLEGRPYVGADLMQRMQTSGEAKPGTARAAPARLSNRELEVLGLIGRGYSTAQIAECLHLSVKTIESHREKIKRKLGLGSGIELTRLAVQFELEQS